MFEKFVLHDKFNENFFFFFKSTKTFLIIRFQLNLEHSIMNLCGKGIFVRKISLEIMY